MQKEPTRQSQLTMIALLISTKNMEKLKTFKIESNQDFDKKIIRQQLIHRLENWLEFYIEKYLDTYDAKIDDAIDQAQLDLFDDETFQRINEDSELIDVNQDDDPDLYQYELDLIQKINLKSIFNSL